MKWHETDPGHVERCADCGHVKFLHSGGYCRAKNCPCGQYAPREAPKPGTIKP